MICKRAKRMKRNVVRRMRALNDSILHDELWKGRFYVSMKEFHYKWYSDNSGVYMAFRFEFKDLKTGFTKDYCMDDFEAGAHNDHPFNRLWYTMNKFITEDIYPDVWGYENDDPNHPRNDKTIYRTR